jgi:hypothetical protein
VTNHSVDDLARGLASGAVTRRRALAVLGASALGLAFPGIAQATIVDDKCDQKCTTDKDCGGKCPKCKDYKCVEEKPPPPDDKCDQKCTTDKDCGGKCPKCKDYKCVEEKPPPPDKKCKKTHCNPRAEEAGGHPCGQGPDHPCFCDRISDSGPPGKQGKCKVKS